MADPTFDHVFAFITETSSLELECHAFLCPKKKMAKAATLTIAQGFSLAYQAWQQENKMKIAEMRRSAAQAPTEAPRSSAIVIQVLKTACDLIQSLLTCIFNPRLKLKHQGMNRNNNQRILLIGQKKNLSNLAMISWISQKQRCLRQTNETGTLLMRFKQKVLLTILKGRHITILCTICQNNVIINRRLSMANAPLQILNQLPQDSAFLKFGAFACTPGTDLGASPLDNPRYV